jgi:hypothetical protein
LTKTTHITALTGEGSEVDASSPIDERRNFVLTTSFPGSKGCFSRGAPHASNWSAAAEYKWCGGGGANGEGI